MSMSSAETWPYRICTSRRSVRLARGARREWLWSLLTVSLCTSIGKLMFPYFERLDLAMIFLLGVVLTASRTSTWPALARNGSQYSRIRFFLHPALLQLRGQRYPIFFHVYRDVYRFLRHQQVDAPCPRSGGICTPAGTQNRIPVQFEPGPGPRAGSAATLRNRHEAYR